MEESTLLHTRLFGPWTTDYKGAGLRALKNVCISQILKHLLDVCRRQWIWSIVTLGLLYEFQHVLFRDKQNNLRFANGWRKLLDLVLSPYETVGCTLIRACFAVEESNTWPEALFWGHKLIHWWSIITQITSSKNNKSLIIRTLEGKNDPLSSNSYI